MESERTIQLSKYHKWDYISSPHLLLGGESGLWKIKSSFYGLIYKFLGETTKIIYSFGVMEREKNYTTLVSIF